MALRWPGRRWSPLAVLMLALVVGVGCSGCGDSSSSRLPPDSAGGRVGRQVPDAVLHGAVELLINEDFLSPGRLRQIVGQLDQWAQAQRPPDDWRLDPLVATLPERLAEMPMVRDLDRLRFPRYDGPALQGVVWLHAVSDWARGGKVEDLSRAKRLFDWTVRNIQLETTTPRQVGGRLGQLPRETLLLGRGTAMERAWVFVLLARQQRLDAALLALADPEDPQPKRLRPFAVGVLSGGRVYLFEPVLGLPIPGPGGTRLDLASPGHGDAPGGHGKGVETSFPTAGLGCLDVRPATLAEARADDTVLRRLDLDPGRPYRVDSADLDRVVALIEASPAYLARRMRLVESRLTGEQKLVLSTDATAQANRWKAVAGIVDARLWALPYQTLAEHAALTAEEAQRRRAATLLHFYAPHGPPVVSGRSPESPLGRFDPFSPLRGTPSRKGESVAPLRKGRVLHLKGKLTGRQAAVKFYQQARPSDQMLANLPKHYYQQILEAIGELPQQKRPPDEDLRQAAVKWARFDAPLLRRAKQDASYWLGLITFELALFALDREDCDQAGRHYGVAVDYFLDRTLAASPDGPWTPGANYNLARSYEATGQYEKAIAHYRANIPGPTAGGNLLRAKWLAEEAEKAGKLHIDSRPRRPNARRPGTEAPDSPLEH